VVVLGSAQLYHVTSSAWTLLVGLSSTGASPNSLIKDTLEVPLRQRRTFQILDGFDLFCHADCLLILYWCHSLSGQLFLDFVVLSKIEFGADKDNGDVRGVMLDFWVPLYLCQYRERRTVLIVTEADLCSDVVE